MPWVASAEGQTMSIQHTMTKEIRMERRKVEHEVDGNCAKRIQEDGACGFISHVGLKFVELYDSVGRGPVTFYP